MVVKTSGGYRKFRFRTYLDYIDFYHKNDNSVESLSFLNSQGWDDSDDFQAEQKVTFIDSIKDFIDLRHLELGFGVSNIHDNISDLINFLSCFSKLREVRLSLRAKSVVDLSLFVSKSSSLLSSLRSLKIEACFVSRNEVLKLLSAISSSQIEVFSLEIKTENYSADKEVYPDKLEFHNNYILREVSIDGIAFQKQLMHRCVFEFLNKCNALRVIKLSGVKSIDEQHANKFLAMLANNRGIEEFYDGNLGSVVSECLIRKIDDIPSNTLDIMELGAFDNSAKHERNNLVFFFAKLLRGFGLAELQVSKETEFYPLLKSITANNFLSSLKITSSPQVMILKKREIEDVGSPKDGIFQNRRLINLPKSIIDSLGCAPAIERNRNIFKRKIDIILNNKTVDFSLFDFQILESQLLVVLKDKQLQAVINLDIKKLHEAWSNLNKLKSFTSFAICTRVENSESNLGFIPDEIINHIFSFIKFREIQII